MMGREYEGRPVHTGAKVRCEDCGHRNPVEHRYCGLCGADML